MKVLIWVLTFLFATILNSLVGEIAGVKLGAGLLCFIELTIANLLCLSWEKKKKARQDTTEAVNEEDNEENEEDDEFT